MADQIEAKFEKAHALPSTQSEEAARIYKEIIATEADADNAEALRCKEQSVYALADIYARAKQAEEIMGLLRGVRSFFVLLAKAKTAKIVRRLLDLTFQAGATGAAQVAICEEMIAWSREQKMTFLRHRTQHRLAQVWFDRGDAIKATNTINALLKEVRRLEDRALLVDIHLLESQVQHSIKSHSKARAALVAARTNANAIYCPPLQQAEIDMQSGVLYAEEHDNKTAFSYLYEAFEGYHGLGDHSREARRALTYMVLSKVLTDKDGDELRAVLAAKSVLEYSGTDIDALRQIAAAYKKKDTHMFNEIVTKYASDLKDVIVQSQLKDMYDQLLENHLLKIIEPYSRVQLDFIAETLKLERSVIEGRLSQLILDKKLKGIVDQQHMCVVIFEEDHDAGLYTETLTTLDSLGKFVGALFDKVNGKFDHLSAEAIKKAEEAEKAKRDAKRKEEAEKLKEKQKEAKK